MSGLVPPQPEQKPGGGTSGHGATAGAWATVPGPAPVQPPVRWGETEAGQPGTAAKVTPGGRAEPALARASGTTSLPAVPCRAVPGTCQAAPGRAAAAVAPGGTAPTFSGGHGCRDPRGADTAVTGSGAGEGRGGHDPGSASPRLTSAGASPGAARPVASLRAGDPRGSARGGGRRRRSRAARQAPVEPVWGRLLPLARSLSRRHDPSPPRPGVLAQGGGALEGFGAPPAVGVQLPVPPCCSHRGARTHVPPPALPVPGVPGRVRGAAGVGAQPNVSLAPPSLLR